MPEWFARLQRDLSNLWNQLSSAQKWLVGGISGALLLGLFGVTMAVYFAPGGELLASGQSAQDIGQLTKFLDSKGVRYSVRNGDVYVYGDREKVMGQYALSSSEKSLGGFAFLKEYNWSQTSAQFNETKLRALSEEIESAIEKGSDLVDWARVLLSERKEGLFPSQDTKPTASVKVGVKRGRQLPTESVQGIQWLVANALPGLKTSDVAVMDSNSRVLEGYSEKSEAEQISNEQRKAETLKREQLVKACANMLDPILGGPSNYTIAANVRLNYDKTAIKEKFIDGESPFAAKVKSEESEEKNTESGGAPGTPSNNPDDTLGKSQKTGQGSSTTSETKEQEFQPRMTREKNIEKALGALEEQSISIAVNYFPSAENGVRTYKQRTPEQMKNLERICKAAVAHIEDNTHYYFVLGQEQFDRTAVDEAEAAVRWETVRANAESVAFLVAAVLSILVFFYFLRRVFSVERTPEEVRMEEEAFEAPSAKMGLRELGLRAIGDVESLPVEEQKSRMIKEQVENYAKSNAEDMAGILKNWLSE
jgi:flagellar M-ring protein FliF